MENPQGEIYFIKNKINGHGYIGQALKHVSSDKIKWGTQGRWKSHVWDAFSEKKKGCTILNNAIVKHGAENFEITKVCDCQIEEMDKLEQEYILKYNTLSPNGYNLTAGGKTGRHSVETNNRKKNPKIDNEEYRKKISLVNIGKRFEKQVRKHEEDSDLPKYICAKRKNGVIIGYQVLKFPIGINTCETITKLFKSKKDPKTGLEKAKFYLAELEIKYSHVIDANIAKKHKLKQQNLINKQVLNYQKDLPLNIHVIVSNNKLDGYCVDGLLDNYGLKIPARSFINKNNIWNLDQAVKFISQVKHTLSENVDENDFSQVQIKRRVKTYNLPRYIRYVYYSGKTTGYRVDNLKIRDEDGKEKKYSKSFSKQSQSMEEKYQLAIDHLQYVKDNYEILA